MNKITVEMLRERNACEEEVKFFENAFGKECDLSNPTIFENSHTVDINWAAKIFLTKPFLEKYQAFAKLHFIECREMARPFLDKYKDAERALRDELQLKSVFTPCKAYEEQEKLLWIEYEKNLNPLRAEYKKALKKMFFDLYSEQTEMDFKP